MARGNRAHSLQFKRLIAQEFSSGVRQQAAAERSISWGYRQLRTGDLFETFRGPVVHPTLEPRFIRARAQCSAGHAHRDRSAELRYEVGAAPDLLRLAAVAACQHCTIRVVRNYAGVQEQHRPFVLLGRWNCGDVATAHRLERDEPSDRRRCREAVFAQVAILAVQTSSRSPAIPPGARMQRPRTAATSEIDATAPADVVARGARRHRLP